MKEREDAIKYLRAFGGSRIMEDAANMLEMDEITIREQEEKLANFAQEASKNAGCLIFLFLVIYVVSLGATIGGFTYYIYTH